MKATEELKKEHQSIKLMLNILGKVASKLEGGETVNSQHIEQILEFITVFSDSCHPSKEEEFPFLSRPRKSGHS